MYFNMNTNFITMKTTKKRKKHTHTHNYFVEGNKMTTINIIHYFWGGGGGEDDVTMKGQKSL